MMVAVLVDSAVCGANKTADEYVASKGGRTAPLNSAGLIPAKL